MSLPWRGATKDFARPSAVPDSTIKTTGWNPKGFLDMSRRWRKILISCIPWWKARISSTFQIWNSEERGSRSVQRPIGKNLMVSKRMYLVFWTIAFTNQMTIPIKYIEHHEHDWPWHFWADWPFDRGHWPSKAWRSGTHRKTEQNTDNCYCCPYLFGDIVYCLRESEQERGEIVTRPKVCALFESYPNRMKFIWTNEKSNESNLGFSYLKKWVKS